jgi:Hyaluronan / mRNA binding family
LKAEEEVGDDDGEDASGEPKVMTLDEWKAREDAKRVKAEFNIRKPGEGVSSDPQWKKMFVLSKKERPEEHEEEEDEQVCPLIVSIFLSILIGSQHCGF